MLGQPCRHRWSTLDPAVTTFVEVELQTQTLVRRAEVVEAADQVHALFEQLRCAH